jgi:hypothetical protein
MGDCDGARRPRPDPAEEELRNPSAADVIGGPGMTAIAQARLLLPRS